jgi:hypothetical protein
LATSWWILAKWRQSADAEEFPAEKDPLLILKTAKKLGPHDPVFSPRPGGRGFVPLQRRAFLTNLDTREALDTVHEVA